MIVVDSPPGMTRPSRPSSSSGRRTSTTSAPSLRSARRVLSERTLQREDADPERPLHRECYQPRTSSRSSSASELEEMPTIGSPRPADTSASTLGSSKCVVASTIAFARVSGSPDLKIPEPTKTPSAPSCMQRDASAGVAMPPAVNVTTGSRPFSATQRIELVRRAVLLRGGVQLVLAQRLERADRAEHRAHVRHRVDDVSRARLALRPDHRRTLGDAAKRLAEVRRAADERHGERPLVDVVLDIGRRQDLGLVDVVDLERLEDLRLGEVADPALRHDRDRDRLLDLLDLLGIAHPRDAAVAADVRGNALERHDRARTCVLGDARLLGVDDVHDDAALQHLGEPRLDPQRPVLGHASESSPSRFPDPCG